MPIRGAGFVSFRGVCAKMVDNVTFLDVSMVYYDSYVSQNAVKVKLNICQALVLQFFWGLAIQECLKLQGLPSKIHEAAEEAEMTDVQVMAAAGNAWPVPVVAKILQKDGEKSHRGVQVKCFQGCAIHFTLLYNAEIKTLQLGNCAVKKMESL